MSLKNCIKCRAQYEETDVEAYYCPTCLTHKQKIALEIDKKFAMRAKEERPMTDLERYDALNKLNGFKGVRFNDL